jgi:hypothetical protein
MTQQEKESAVVDLVQDIATASPGEKFLYRGLTVQRKPEQSRKDAIAIVRAPSGETVAEVDLQGNRTRQLVEAFDNMRMEVVNA